MRPSSRRCAKPKAGGLTEDYDFYMKPKPTLKTFAKKTRANLKRDFPEIYEHFLAHLSDEELVHQLTQAQRVLRAGGAVGFTFGYESSPLYVTAKDARPPTKTS